MSTTPPRTPAFDDVTVQPGTRKLSPIALIGENFYPRIFLL